LGKANIGATVNYKSVPTMGYYSNKYGFTGQEYPISKSWGDGTLSIPLFPGMKDEEQDYVIDVLINKIDEMIGENQ
jgi:UDP-4-amino-4-deoxy-L-arabinose-oxoglutarate aminotransferase